MFSVESMLTTVLLCVELVVQSMHAHTMQNIQHTHGDSGEKTRISDDKYIYDKDSTIQKEKVYREDTTCNTYISIYTLYETCVLEAQVCGNMSDRTSLCVA